MSQETTIEARLARLEQDVDRLKQQQAGRQNADSAPKPGWLDRITGSMKDYPEFEQVLELGRAIRQADRPDEDSSATTP
jgi:hypothetical protein